MRRYRAERARHMRLRRASVRVGLSEMEHLHLTTAQKKQALSDPKVRARVLERLRWAVRTYQKELDLSPAQLAEVDAQLQSPPMYLYATGLFEVVTPAFGPEKEPLIEWKDSSVRLVFEPGLYLTAGKVVWTSVVSRPSS